LVHFVNFWHELIVFYKFQELILNAQIISILLPSKKSWYSTYFFHKLIKRASKCAKVTKSLFSQLINCFNDRYEILKKFWQKMIADDMSIQKIFSILKLMEIFDSKKGKKDQKLAFFWRFLLGKLQKFCSFFYFLAWINSVFQISRTDPECSYYQYSFAIKKIMIFHLLFSEIDKMGK